MRSERSAKIRTVQLLGPTQLDLMVGGRPTRKRELAFSMFLVPPDFL